MNPRVASHFAIALLALFVATAVRADEGMVIWKNNDCGYFILQTKSGYGLYEWVAGPYPNAGDVIVGELKATGEHKVNNKTADVPTTILVDAFATKRMDVSSRLPVRCKGKSGEPLPENQ